MTDTPDQTGSQTPSSGTESGPPAAPAPAKAELGKRAIALIIDAVATMVVGFIPLIGGMIATAYWLLRDGMDVEFMDHRSLGKKLMKLRPVMLDGSPVDMASSAKRNWMFALGGIAGFFCDDHHRTGPRHPALPGRVRARDCRGCSGADRR